MINPFLPVKSTLFNYVPAVAASLVCKRFIQTIKVGIIGSGPAGFYTAQALLKVRFSFFFLHWFWLQFSVINQINWIIFLILFKDSRVQIDIYEKYPVPFGLIRFGVAPDHQSVKVNKDTRKIESHIKLRLSIHFCLD